MLNNPSSYRRMLRAHLRPLVVTALDPRGTESLVLDPELLWAARLDELEQVELWTPAGGRVVTSVTLGPAGEVQVQGGLAQIFHPGDVLAVLAYAYVPQDAIEAHEAHFVEIGPGNRAIEINCRPVRSQLIHPSYLLPGNEGKPWAGFALPAGEAAGAVAQSW